MHMQTSSFLINTKYIWKSSLAASKGTRAIDAPATLVWTLVWSKARTACRRAPREEGGEQLHRSGGTWSTPPPATDSACNSPAAGRLHSHVLPESCMVHPTMNVFMCVTENNLEHKDNVNKSFPFIEEEI